jgi:hypothetical protein
LSDTIPKKLKIAYRYSSFFFILSRNINDFISSRAFEALACAIVAHCQPDLADRAEDDEGHED